MTIRTLPNQYIPSNGTVYSVTYSWYYWFKWMKQASPVGPGWTVKASHDGAGNYGTGDYISDLSSTGTTQLNTYTSSTDRAWVVLQAPDGREILFYKESATAGQFRVYYAPATTGGFSGGTTTPPTVSGQLFMTNQAPAHGAYTAVLHCAADDAAPYGFWAYTHLSGQVGYEEFSLAQLPLDVVAATGDTDPFVTWFANTYTTSGGITVAWLTYENPSYSYIFRSTKPDGTGGATISAHYLRNANSSYFFPNNIELLPTGEDVSMPLTFGRNATSGAGFFKGISSWFQWNGYTRAVGEMFAARSRVSIGDINVPWDGTSDWLSS